MKKRFYTELSYLFGIIALALGTALSEKANFGLSMVVAPAYLVHLKVSQVLPFFTFGMAEYSLQAVVLIMLAIIMRKFKLSYLFSFITAVFYGLVLDLFIMLLAMLPGDMVLLQCIYYVIGIFTCSLGVSLLFHTYISPEAYELFVKEISEKLGKDINKVKTVYDVVSCLIAIILSFIFFGFGHFEGVKLGTTLCAIVNGSIIGMISRSFEKKYEFVDGLSLRGYFSAEKATIDG